MKTLIKDYNAVKRLKIGKFCYRTNGNVIVIGKYINDTFDGSDKLSMSVLLDLDAFIALTKGQIIIAEGDRFTNSTYIKKTNPIIIKITGDGAIGRKIRGSQQTERQIKTIATRVSNIMANFEVNNSNEALTLINKLIGSPAGLITT
jgi:hypothetical protein